MIDREYKPTDEVVAADNLIEVVHLATSSADAVRSLEICGITTRAMYLAYEAMERYSGDLSPDMFQGILLALCDIFMGKSLVDYGDKETEIVLNTMINTLIEIRDDLR